MDNRMFSFEIVQSKHVQYACYGLTKLAPKTARFEEKEYKAIMAFGFVSIWMDLDQSEKTLI